MASMIECLASLLAGAPLLSTAFDDPALRHEHVQNGVCIALDPELFLAPGAFAGEVERLVDGVNGSTDRRQFRRDYDARRAWRSRSHAATARRHSAANSAFGGTN